MSYKVSVESKEASFSQLDEFNKIKGDKFLTTGDYLIFSYYEKPSPVGTRVRDKKVGFSYLIVESTGFHIPVTCGNAGLFWLDAEAGFLYKSLSALPVYVPLVNVKGAVESFGFKWDSFLEIVMSHFQPSKFADLWSIFSGDTIYDNLILSDEFETEKSMASNFFTLSRPASRGPNGTVSRELDRKLNDLRSQCIDYFKPNSLNVFLEFCNPDTVLGVKTPFFIANPGAVMLENSFQSPLLKDLMGAMSPTSEPTTLIKKLRDSGIFSTLKTDGTEFMSRPLDSYFNARFQTSALLPLPGVPKGRAFPYEIIQNQVSKLVRRFRIKGVI